MQEGSGTETVAAAATHISMAQAAGQHPYVQKAVPVVWTQIQVTAARKEVVSAQQNIPVVAGDSVLRAVLAVEVAAVLRVPMVQVRMVVRVIPVVRVTRAAVAVVVLAVARPRQAETALLMLGTEGTVRLAPAEGSVRRATEPERLARWEAEAVEVSRTARVARVARALILGPWVQVVEEGVAGARVTEPEPLGEHMAAVVVVETTAGVPVVRV